VASGLLARAACKGRAGRIRDESFETFETFGAAEVLAISRLVRTMRILRQGGDA